MPGVVPMNWATLAIMAIGALFILAAWKQGAIGTVVRLIPGAAVFGLAVGYDGAGKYLVAAVGAVLAGAVWSVTLQLPLKRAAVLAAGAMPCAIGMVLGRALATPLGALVAGLGSLPFGIAMFVALRGKRGP
jgi:hypothetical protein